ncbi:Hypothetical predicted protein [Octopus vulgaris]|uniref:Uncharacterized protein n=1 Tax=Octopus vulgaris TaxID=6645 RepID=A0AA36AYM3_OCTVU|nr:Hypothetical predicted protein [Octopus vulgaris]
MILSYFSTSVTTLLTTEVTTADLVLRLLSVTHPFRYYFQFHYSSNHRYCSKPRRHCCISGDIVRIRVATVVSHVRRTI